MTSIQKDINGNKAPTQEELITQYKEQIKALKYEIVNLQKENKKLIKIIQYNQKKGKFELELIKLQNIYRTFSKNIENFILIKLKEVKKWGKNNGNGKYDNKQRFRLS